MVAAIEAKVLPLLREAVQAFADAEIAPRNSDADFAAAREWLAAIRQTI